jgi:hypothetical protein
VKIILPFAFALALLGCDSGSRPSPDKDGAPRQVETTGKRDVPLGQVPPDVLSVAQAARPGFAAATAEAEMREGRRYFDVSGKLKDGTEIEFDILESDGKWRVVEVQRDIAFTSAPAPVVEAARAHDRSFQPSRVIESSQEGEGIVIYELFGPRGNDRQGRKMEIKWDGGSAVLLKQEWAH